MKLRDYVAVFWASLITSRSLQGLQWSSEICRKQSKPQESLVPFMHLAPEQVLILVILWMV